MTRDLASGRLWLVCTVCYALSVVALPAGGESADIYAHDRSEMVRRQLESTDIVDTSVLAAMRKVPRHEFIPEHVRGEAYLPRPVPVGYGQTISQPYIVAYMTQALELKPGDRVLEVGTGSAYQAAVLAEITSSVRTIEIIPELAAESDRVLKRLGYDAVQRRQGDGYHGWPEGGPYDAIMVTAAASHVPPPLVSQLAPGGRMILPVGETAWTQNLVMVRRDAHGRLQTETLIPVRFVPLTGGH